MPRLAFLLGVIVFAAVVGLGTAALPQFADVTDASGLRFQNNNSPTPEKYLIETMTGGVAMLDYDGDGRLDLFFTNGAKLKPGAKQISDLDKSAPEFWNRLFRNEGDGRFVDLTEKAGVRGRGYSMGAAVADWNNDGDADLLVTNYGSVILYRNDGSGAFAETTVEAGLGGATGWFSSAGFVDYDGDGLLDLFLCRYLDWSLADNKYCGSRTEAGRAYCHPDNFKPISNLLYRNNGDGTFTDVSARSGIAKAEGKALGVAFHDFDGDGRIDITVANDSFSQFLFHNNGDGTFTETALLAGSAYDEDGKTFAGMGTEAADVDGDGWPDIVTTALSNERYAYFRNNGDGSFTYASQESGLADITRLFAGWGLRIADFDLDGVRDIFFANSHVMDNISLTQPHIRYKQPPLLLRGINKRLVDVSSDSGTVFQRPIPARGLASGDLDNDGDLDVVLSQCGGPAVLLRNDGGSRNGWIGLQLRGVKSNRDAIGAKVEVLDTAGRTQHFLVSTAGSYQSAHDGRLLVGFGPSASAKEIRIAWPSGARSIVRDPAMRKYHTLAEPATEAAP